MKSVRKIALIVTSMITIFISSILSASASETMLRYSNVVYANAMAEVFGTGLLSIDYDYMGKSDFTRVEINTLVERQTLYFFWSDVAEWTDILTDISYTDTTTLQLAEKGTYRITVEYTFYGLSEECDTITCEIEVKY